VKSKVRKQARPPAGSPRALASRAARPWNDRAILGVILLAGLALRGAYLAELVHKPDFDSPLSDAQYHDYWARALVTGHWTPPKGLPDPQIQATPYFLPPGYPFFLAAVYRLAGQGYLAPRLVQMAIGLVNVILAYLVGRAIFHRVVGLIGAALVAGYWGLIYFEGEFHPTPLLVALGLLLVWVGHGWARRHRFWRAALVGLLLGLFAVLRSNVLLVAPVFVAWAAWVGWRTGMRWRRGLAHALAFCAALAAPIAPVTARNYVVGHELVLLSANGGINLYIGNNPQASPVTPRIPEVEQLITRSGWNLFRWPEIVQAVADQQGRSMTHSQASRYFAGRAWEFIRARPATALAYAGERALLMWGPREVSNNKVDAFEHARSSALWWLPGFPAVLAGFIVGLVLWCADRQRARRSGAKLDAEARARGQGVVFLLLFVAAYSFSFVPFLAAGRFRVPYIPLLLLFGAYGVWRIAQLAWVRRFGAALWGLAGWGAAYALASIPFVSYQPDLGSWYLDRATAYVQKGELEPAIAEYRAAIEANPDFPESYAALAGALVERGDFEEAVATYRRAIRMAPRSAEMRRALAALLHDLSRFDEAVPEYRAVLDISPKNADTWYQYGRALEATRADAEALAAYRQAVELEPTLGEARVNLGVLLQKGGDLAGAAAAYRGAIEQVPNLLEAHFNLATVLATQGDLEGAIREVSTALHIQPQHAAARDLLGYLQEQRRKEAAPSGPGRGPGDTKPPPGSVPDSG